MTGLTLIRPARLGSPPPGASRPAAIPGPVPVSPAAPSGTGWAMHDRNASRRHGQPAAGPGRLRGPVNAGLAGTGRVADDLYLMAHHDLTGKPFLQPRPLGLGLAGGAAGRADAGRQHRPAVRRRGAGRPHLARRRPGPPGPRPDRRRARAAPAAGLAGRSWRAPPPADVAGRLERAGYLTRVRGWVPWRPGRWVPADPDCAFGRCCGSAPRWTRPGPRPRATAVLAGLAAACGLGFRPGPVRGPRPAAASSKRPG